MTQEELQKGLRALESMYLPCQCHSVLVDYYSGGRKGKMSSKWKEKRPDGKMCLKCQEVVETKNWENYVEDVTKLYFQFNK